MKYLIYILAFIMLISCVNRKKDLTTHQENQSVKTEQTSQEKESIEQTQSATTNIAQFLENTNFKIVGNGQNYQMQYGSLSFVGSADLEFNNSKSQIITKTLYKSHITYKSQKIYKTYNITKTTIKNKDLHVTAERSVFSERLVFFLLGVLASILTYFILKTKLLKP